MKKFKILLLSIILSGFIATGCTEEFIEPNSGGEEFDPLLNTAETNKNDDTGGDGEEYDPPLETGG